MPDLVDIGAGASLTTGSDQVVRSMTRDGAFRVITILATDTVRAAVQSQSASGVTARWLGEAIVGAILVREAMSPERRVQVLIKDVDGRTQLVADAHPEGWNRGIVRPGADEGDDPSRNALLEVLYTLPNNVLQQGVVEIPAGGDLSSGLMVYMQESEQVTSMIAVRAIVDNETTVRAAGGYLVQLLPEASREALQSMTDVLTSFTGLESILSGANASADSLREAVLEDIEAQEMARTYLCFGCNCSQERILTGLSSLPRSDIQEMIDDDDALVINCDACGKHYAITVVELKQLLDQRRGVKLERPLQN